MSEAGFGSMRVQACRSGSVKRWTTGRPSARCRRGCADETRALLAKPSDGIWLPQSFLLRRGTERLSGQHIKVATDSRFVALTAYKPMSSAIGCAIHERGLYVK